MRERITTSLTIPDQTTAGVLDPDNGLLYLITDQGIASLDIHSLPIGIGSVAPAVGGAGTLITIRGTGFDANTTVLIDDQTVNATLRDAESIEFVAPVHAEGTVQVKVKAADGTQDSFDAAFAYTGGAPGVRASDSGKPLGRIRLRQVPLVVRPQLPAKHRKTLRHGGSALGSAKPATSNPIH
jgi:hypothetical protein